uniref:Uncharacterized protein n=1 Tax=viral metagenome TaxID=1070528 RepID=A0A6C0H553_9ZZZZ
MEIALPILALGSFYIVSKNNKENFKSMGQKNNYLPNTNLPVKNYPITTKQQIDDSVNYYPDPNTATDIYFDQNVYENNSNKHKRVGNNIQQIYSLTGDYVNSSEFKHANMVPFFGSKIKGQIYNNNNSETILDNMVGSGSQVIKKIEQAPLFKPQENMQFNNGTPNNSDFYQSRQNPAMRNHMVKPFESVHVGPGLDQGYSDKGSLGFNSGMEARDKWLPKTVDELRTNNNPKQTFDLVGLEGPAHSAITNLGIQGKVEKYRPDGFFINTQDRWLTTVGAEKGNRPISEEIFQNSHRAWDTNSYIGVPVGVDKHAGHAPVNFEQSKRISVSETNHVNHSNAVSQTPFQSIENHHNNHSILKNNRSVNHQSTNFGNIFSRSIIASIAPIVDAFKPTRKEEFTDNIRVFGNIGSTVSSNYVIDSTKPLPTTIKETTLHASRGNIGTGQMFSNNYDINNFQPIHNQRDNTTENNYVPPGGSNYGMRNVDAEYRQHNNDLKTTEGRTPIGNISLYSGNINMQINKQNGNTENNRFNPPASIIKIPAHVENYGMQHGPNNPIENYDRIQPWVVDAFKENPYTHSLTNAV